MIATACFLIFLAFFIFYGTSAKVKGNGHFMHRRPGGSKLAAKAVALTLFLSALVILVSTLGFGAGMFYGLIILMVSGSLVVLLTPLEVVTAKSAIPLFIVFLIIEYFLKF